MVYNDLIDINLLGRFWDNAKQHMSGGTPTLIGRASGSVVNFVDTVGNEPLKSLIVNIEAAQAGSGDASPSNIRAISGWAVANTARVGKNLLELNNLTDGTRSQYGLTWTLASGVLSVNGTASSGGDYVFAVTSAAPHLLAKSGDYILSGGTSKLRVNARIRGGPANRYIATPTTGGELEFSLGAGEYIDRVYVAITSGSTYAETLSPMIRQKGASADFEAYLGTLYSISFGQTVYGGKLNIITGELTVTHKAADMGDLSWVYHAPDTTHPLGYLSTSSLTDKEAGELNVVSSAYKTQNGSGVWAMENVILGNGSTSSVYVVNPSYSDGTAFKTAMSGQKIVYEVSTPATYQLTPAEATTLLGENNIWADCGPVSVEYWQNPVLRDAIQSMIDATVLGAIGGSY